jgi:hypothetical protein
MRCEGAVEKEEERGGWERGRAWRRGGREGEWE